MFRSEWSLVVPIINIRTSSFQEELKVTSSLQKGLKRRESTLSSHELSTMSSKQQRVCATNSRTPALQNKSQYYSYGKIQTVDLTILTSKWLPSTWTFQTRGKLWYRQEEPTEEQCGVLKTFVSRSVHKNGQTTTMIGTILFRSATYHWQKCTLLQVVVESEWNRFWIHARAAYKAPVCTCSIKLHFRKLTKELWRNR